MLYYTFTRQLNVLELAILVSVFQNDPPATIFGNNEDA